MRALLLRADRHARERAYDGIDEKLKREWSPRME